MRFLKALLLYPIGKPRETPEQKLERIVRETRESYACEQYRRRRAAALKHTRRAA